MFKKTTLGSLRKFLKKFNFLLKNQGALLPLMSKLSGKVLQCFLPSQADYYKRVTIRQ